MLTVVRNRNEKDRQYNQMERDKRETTVEYLSNINATKNEGKYMCSGMVRIVLFLY